MTVKIFSLPKCIYCQQLKELMTEANIPYIDVNCDLEENTKEFEDLVALTNCHELPMVVVGHQVLIPETSFRSIPEALQVTKMILG